MKRKPIAIDFRDGIVFYKEHIKDTGYSIFCGRCSQEAGDAEYLEEISPAMRKRIIKLLKDTIKELEE